MPQKNAALHPIAAAVALALLQAGASAQTPASVTGEITVVTVTAERRLENIRDVPSALSSLQGETLEVMNSGGQDVRQVAGRVPSLNIDSSFGRAFPRCYIRGIGNTDFDLNASQPLSLELDDVVQDTPILKGFPLLDLASIEVLNGPPGTLFGRNSPAGVVRFESAKPDRGFEAYALSAVGSDRLFNVEGMVNAPLGLKEGALDYAVDEHNARLVTLAMRQRVDAAKADIVTGRLKAIDASVTGQCR